MTEAFICAAIRTPVGRYGGSLAGIRADDLGAIPIRALMQRHPGLDWAAVDDVIYGCANQAGEDNRDVARMCALLAGLPEAVPGTTVNRLCGSGMDAIGIAARSIKAGEVELMIAGGVESMSRAPFVMGKAETALARDMRLYDTTIGWRFVNPKLRKRSSAPIRCRRPPTTWPRTFGSAARTRTASRCARSSAGPPRTRRASSARRSCRSRCRRRAASRGCSTPTSIRAPTRRWRSWPSSRASTARS